MWTPTPGFMKKLFTKPRTEAVNQEIINKMDETFSHLREEKIKAILENPLMSDEDFDQIQEDIQKDQRTYNEIKSKLIRGEESEEVEAEHLFEGSESDLEDLGENQLNEELLKPEEFEESLGTPTSDAPSSEGRSTPSSDEDDFKEIRHG